MSGKTSLFLLFFVCLLTMCTSSAPESITYENGLSCVSVRGEDVNCTYTCSDGSTQEVDISDPASSLITSSREDLEVEICGATPRPTATAMESLLTVFPVSTNSAAPRVSRTPRGSPTGTVAAILPTGGSLLTGTVSMCDLGGKLINFRIAPPVQDLSGHALKLQIAERESTCYVNPTNRSLLTCLIPIGVSFPARVVVWLDGDLVNDFVYNGLGCAVITTPTPVPRPTREQGTPAPTTYP